MHVLSMAAQNYYPDCITCALYTTFKNLGQAFFQGLAAVLMLETETGLLTLFKFFIT